MKEIELQILEKLLDRSSWLFYGDWEEEMSLFVREILKNEFREYGFEEIKLEGDKKVAYWLLLSELVRLNLAEYGTSPRGAWLTEEGKKFKEIVMEHKDWLEQVEEHIYQQNH